MNFYIEYIKIMQNVAYCCVIVCLGFIGFFYVSVNLISSGGPKAVGTKWCGDRSRHSPHNCADMNIIRWWQTHLDAKNFEGCTKTDRQGLMQWWISVIVRRYARHEASIHICTHLPWPIVRLLNFLVGSPHAYALWGTEYNTLLEAS